MAYILHCPLAWHPIADEVPHLLLISRILGADVMAQPTRNPNASASTSSTCSRSSTRSTHRYVDEREAELIQDWSSQVPDKLPKEMTISDPSVQAYIAATLALLRSNTPTR
jgi:hypothetical protein